MDLAVGGGSVNFTSLLPDLLSPPSSSALQRHLNLSNKKIPNEGRENLAGWLFCEKSVEPVLSA